MIVRYVGAQTLMDCEALAVELRRPASTIRAKCTAITTDPTTGRKLFDRDAAAEALSAVGRRAPHRRARRS